MVLRIRRDVPCSARMEATSAVERDLLSLYLPARVARVLVEGSAIFQESH